MNKYITIIEIKITTITLTVIIITIKQLFTHAQKVPFCKLLNFFLRKNLCTEAMFHKNLTKHSRVTNKKLPRGRGCTL